MAGTHRLPAELMSGSGLRVLECRRLRVKDLDFGRHQVVVRDGKGEKDRVVPLPRRLEAKLRDQVADARALHSPPRRGARPGLAPLRLRGRVAGGRPRVRLAVPVPVVEVE